MEIITIWINKFKIASSELFDQFMLYLPYLLGALLLLFFGVLVARLLQSLSFRMTSGINKVLDRILKKGVFVKFRLSDPFARLLSRIVFWITILFFATVATRILGIEAFNVWLNRVVAYFPTFVVGGLIVVAGVLLSAFARDITTSALITANVPHGRLVGGVVQGATLITAVVIGLDQIGIQVTFLVTLIAVLMGTVVGSFTLAVALGARDLVSNLISGHYVQQQYQIGQKIKLGEIEGTVIEMTPVAVILATEDGRMTVPARLFQSQSSLLILQGSENG